MCLKSYEQGKFVGISCGEIMTACRLRGVRPKRQLHVARIVNYLASVVANGGQ